MAFDSADAWAAPELFQFDEENNPIRVAGCPPDAFAKTGQLWGNPLYNWEYSHQKTGYARRDSENPVLFSALMML